MALCVSVMELDRWGQGNRVPKCQEYLSRYGGNAKEVLPQLQAIRDGFTKSGKLSKADQGAVKTLDEMIANINASKESPKLVNLKDYLANPTPIPKKSKK